VEWSTGRLAFARAHYGVIKLLALTASGENRTGERLPTLREVDADHSPDHNRPRQFASLSDLAKRVRPGQPRYAATCLLFASRGSGVQVPLAPPGKTLMAKIAEHWLTPRIDTSWLQFEPRSA
jgi:hypothetical protein